MTENCDVFHKLHVGKFVDMEKGETLIDLEGDIDSPALSGRSSYSGRMTAINLTNASAREWISSTREKVKPWGEFVNTSKFAYPKSLAPLPKRIVKNVDHFQGNYMFVFLGLVLFCVLTSPMLLIAMAVCLGACYIINIRNKETKLTLLGKELSLAQQYSVVGVCSFPLFWLAGAGGAVFWVIGASFFVIMLHASFYKPLDEEEPFDADMEPV